MAEWSEAAHFVDVSAVSRIPTLIECRRSNLSCSIGEMICCLHSNLLSWRQEGHPALKSSRANTIVLGLTLGNVLARRKTGVKTVKTQSINPLEPNVYINC